MAYIQNFGNTSANSLSNEATSFLADQRKRNILRANAKERLKTLNNAFGVDSDYHVGRQGDVQVGNKKAFELESEDLSRSGEQFAKTEQISSAQDKLQAGKKDNLALQHTQWLSDYAKGNSSAKDGATGQLYTLEELSNATDENLKNLYDDAQKMADRDENVTMEEAVKRVQQMQESQPGLTKSKIGGIDEKRKSEVSSGEDYKRDDDASYTHDAEAYDTYRQQGVNKAGFKDNLGVSMRSLLLNQALTDAQNTVGAGYGAQTTNQFDDLVKMRKDAIDQYNQTIAKDQVYDNIVQAENAEKLNEQGAIGVMKAQGADTQIKSEVSTYGGDTTLSNIGNKSNEKEKKWDFMNQDGALIPMKEEGDYITPVGADANDLKPNSQAISASLGLGSKQIEVKDKEGNIVKKTVYKRIEDLNIPANGEHKSGSKTIKRKGNLDWYEVTDSSTGERYFINGKMNGAKVRQGDRIAKSNHALMVGSRASEKAVSSQAGDIKGN